MRLLQVVIQTAFSGEEAVRITREQSFHVITMDEQMSSAYCSDMKQKQESSGPEITLFYELVFGNDRLSNAKARAKFFECEVSAFISLCGV